MNKVIIGALALTFAASAAAYAQTTPPPPPKTPAPGEKMAPPPPPPPGHGPMAGHEMGGPGHHGHWRHHKGMWMMSKAAHFRVRSGDMMVDVKCADDDTTKECGDVVMQIVNRLSAAQSDNSSDYDADDNGTDIDDGNSGGTE